MPLEVRTRYDRAVDVFVSELKAISEMDVAAQPEAQEGRG